MCKDSPNGGSPSHLIALAEYPTEVLNDLCVSSQIFQQEAAGSE